MTFLQKIFYDIRGFHNINKGKKKNRIIFTLTDNHEVKMIEYRNGARLIRIGKRLEVIFHEVYHQFKLERFLGWSYYEVKEAFEKELSSYLSKLKWHRCWMPL